MVSGIPIWCVYRPGSHCCWLRRQSNIRCPLAIVFRNRKSPLTLRPLGPQISHSGHRRSAKIFHGQTCDIGCHRGRRCIARSTGLFHRPDHRAGHRGWKTGRLGSTNIWIWDQAFPSPTPRLRAWASRMATTACTNSHNCMSSILRSSKSTARTCAREDRS